MLHAAALPPVVGPAPTTSSLHAQELLSQQRSLASLVVRNRDAPVEAVQAAAAAGSGPTPLQLPFIIIQVSLPFDWLSLSQMGPAAACCGAAVQQQAYMHA